MPCRINKEFVSHLQKHISRLPNKKHTTFSIVICRIIKHISVFGQKPCTKYINGQHIHSSVFTLKCSNIGNISKRLFRPVFAAICVVCPKLSLISECVTNLLVPCSLLIILITWQSSKVFILSCKLASLGFFLGCS